MTKIRTLEIGFERVIKNIMRDFMERIDYNNYSDSFDEGIYYFHDIAEQPITRAINTVHIAGYKDANKLIKNRMKTAAVIDKSTTLIYIVQKLTDKLQNVTENHKEEIQEKLIQHQTEQFTYNQIVDDLLTFFDYDSIAASRFARTGTNYIYNQAHLRRYRDVGFIPGTRYAAHLDEVTSKICRMLNGTIWALDDPNIISPPSHFNCLVAGTKIITKHGEKNIEDIKIRDMVLTHTLKYKPVTDRMISKTNYVLNISTNHRSISVTGDHPIYTNYNECNMWIPAKRLRVSDNIITIFNSTDSKDIFNTITQRVEYIKSINIKNADIVYNFSVLDDESYTANGIVVHNCRTRLLPYYGKIPGKRDYTTDFDTKFIEEAENTLHVFKTKYWDM